MKESQRITSLYSREQINDVYTCLHFWKIGVDYKPEVLEELTQRLKSFELFEDWLSLADKNKLPPDHAVYVVRSDEVILYVGQSCDLRKRWIGHNRFDTINVEYPHAEIGYLLIPVSIWMIYSEFSELLEEFAIFHLDPKYNVRGKPLTRKILTQEQRDIRWENLVSDCGTKLQVNGKVTGTFWFWDSLRINK